MSREKCSCVRIFCLGFWVSIALGFDVRVRRFFRGVFVENESSNGRLRFKFVDVDDGGEERVDGGDDGRCCRTREPYVRLTVALVDIVVGMRRDRDSM